MTIKVAFYRHSMNLLCLAALTLSACGPRRALQRADNDYQQALAAEDLPGQRRALLALVKADESVSDNWIRLAYIDLELGAYRDAYEHFSRAHDIDRTAVAPLSMMTELAVINGRLDLAQGHLKELTVISPDDRAVAVAEGFEALREGNSERAQAEVTTLLMQNPDDSIANVLQTRVLVSQRDFPAAIERLERQRARSPRDRAMLRSLGALYRYRGNWSAATSVDLQLWKLSPTDIKIGTDVVGDALQAGNLPVARLVTSRFLTKGLADLLSEWTRSATGASYQPEPGRLLAATDRARLELAHYFNKIGRPQQALELLGRHLKPDRDSTNAHFNAVFGEALFVAGQRSAALTVLNSVLRIEPDEPVALAARARALSQAGNHRAAIIDAERLVASFDSQPDYRLLLADIHLAAGSQRGADRALWDGYRDLPANRLLYNAVRQVFLSRHDQDGLSRLDNDFEAERYSEVVKELA